MPCRKRWTSSAPPSAPCHRPRTRGKGRSPPPADGAACSSALESAMPARAQTSECRTCSGARHVISCDNGPMHWNRAVVGASIPFLVRRSLDAAPRGSWPRSLAPGRSRRSRSFKRRRRGYQTAPASAVAKLREDLRLASSALAHEAADSRRRMLPLAEARLPIGLPACRWSPRGHGSRIWLKTGANLLLFGLVAARAISRRPSASPSSKTVGACLHPHDRPRAAPANGTSRTGTRKPIAKLDATTGNSNIAVTKDQAETSVLFELIAALDPC